jgi:hypothetical protein
MGNDVTPKFVQSSVYVLDQTDPTEPGICCDFLDRIHEQVSLAHAPEEVRARLDVMSELDEFHD